MRRVIHLSGWTGMFLLLCALAAAGLPWLPVLQDSFATGRIARYMEREGQPIGPGAEDLRIRLPDGIEQSRLILLGGIHGFADIHAFDLAVLRHLADRTGLRVYLAEAGPDVAMAFNAMVLDGDDDAARRVFDAWADRDLQWANKEFFAKLESITAWNRTLPEDSRIVFVGIDRPEGPQPGTPGVKGPMPGPTVAPGFGGTDAIRSINRLLLDEALRRPDDAGRYDHILANIERLLTLPGADGHQFYGLWGLFHASKSAVNGLRPLALELDAEGGLLEKDVATIGSYCMTGCFTMMPRHALPGFLHGPGDEAYSLVPLDFDNPYLQRVRGAGAVTRGLGEDRAVLLPLAEEGSPFTSGRLLSRVTGYLTLLAPFEHDQPAAAIFDAVILHQASPPLTPWADEAHNVSGRALPAR